MARPLAFLDCEFTPTQPARLLSMGLSCLRGTEVYAEHALTSTPARTAMRRANAFVRSVVVPQFGVLPQAHESTQAFGDAIAGWLSRFTEGVDVVYDHHTDFDLLEELLTGTGHWTTLRGQLEPVHVAYLWGDTRAHDAAQASWAATAEAITGIGRHHALADARALGAAFEAVHGPA